MALKTITTKALSEATGASLRQLDTWATKGYIVEAGEPATQGHARQWTSSTVKHVRHMLRLIEIGFPAAKATEYAAKASFAGASTYVVETNGFRMAWVLS